MGFVSYLIIERYKKEILKLRSINKELEIRFESTQNIITQKEKLILDNYEQYKNNINELREDYEQRFQKLEEIHKENIELLKENYKTQNEILLMKNQNMLNEDSK